MRRIPFIGRVATEKDFQIFIEGQEQKLEEFTESSDRLIKRRLEDLGWKDIAQNPGIGLSDQSPTKRREVVRRAVHYWINDPLVGTGIDLYNAYIFGRGLPKPRFEFKDAQDVIDQFWKHPDNKLVLTTSESQYQKSTELQTQGNLWLVLFVDVDGNVTMSDLIDAEVKDVICHPENRKKHLFYKQVIKPVVYDFKQHQYLPQEDARQEQEQTRYYADWQNWPLPDDDKYAEMMTPDKIEEGVVFHISINRLSDGKFGNPRVQRVLDWAYAYNQFMRARVSLMEAAAWLAWKRKTKGNEMQIRRQAAGFADARFDAVSQTNDGTPAPPPPRYAALITENENSTMEFVKTDTGSANAKNDGMMLKAQFGAGINMPIHYFGDASGGANLATATAMELPVLKTMEAGQEGWEGNFKGIVDFQIAAKIKAGKLPKPKTGKFSDIEGDDVTEVQSGKTLREVGFTEAAIAKILSKAEYAEHIKEANKDSNGLGDDIDISKVSGDDLYAYDLALPPILQRQVAETVNAVVNIVQSFDPNGTNDELVRWAFDYCLKTFNVSNVPEVMERVFPKGTPIDREPRNGPVDPFAGGERDELLGVHDGIGRKGKPGDKNQTNGPTNAWTPEQHAQKESETDVDAPLLHEIKQEFEQIHSEIYGTLTDELIASAVAGEDGNGQPGTE